MDPKAVREWAAEYRRSNKADDERRKERLLLETIEESVRSYSTIFIRNGLTQFAEGLEKLELLTRFNQLYENV